MGWFAVRVPGLEGRYDAALLAVRPPAPRAMDSVAAAAVAQPGVAPAAVRVLARTLRAFVGGERARPGRMQARLATSPAGGRGAVAVRAEAPGVTLSVPAPMIAPAPGAGFDLATQAYARLAAGDRRGAERLFGAAIAAPGAPPQAGAWVRERRRLNRRWSGEAYALFRDAGSGGGAAASPVLGGGQSGASAAWRIDPLARRPLAVTGRVYAAHDARSRIDGETAQAAMGLQWQPVAGVSMAAERLVAIGAATRGDWNLRVAAGGERQWGPVVIEGYGEAGARGNGDVYAGGQARAAVGLGTAGGMVFSAGPGAWGSFQTGFSTVSRVDVGAQVTGRLRAGVAVSADWRWRVAGNAAPVQGPAVTVSVGF